MRIAGMVVHSAMCGALIWFGVTEPSLAAALVGSAVAGLAGVLLGIEVKS